MRRVFRAHNPRWAFAAESGKGAALHGGRFNPKGVDALYTSLRVQTAWLEAQQAFPFKGQPMTVCEYEVDCEQVVDLTDPTERNRLGVELTDLSCPWEDLADRGLMPPSWALAGRLMASEVAGVIVPSFAAGATRQDINAVFWRWTSDLPHKVAVIDDLGRLPKDDASWR